MTDLPTPTVPPSLPSRELFSLALLGLPLSLLLAVGTGLLLMGLADCRHLPHGAGVLGVSMAVVAAGALGTSVLANLWRARRSARLAEAASVPVEAGDVIETLRVLASTLGVPAPSLRVLASEQPLAFCVLGRTPTLVISSWVLATLTESEREALLAHELAHLRTADRLLRWWGSGLWRATRGIPGLTSAWHTLDLAMEDRADSAAMAALGTEHPLRSARQKFLGAANGALPADMRRALTPWPLGHRLAMASLGGVLAMPLLPLLLVPLCTTWCAR